MTIKCVRLFLLTLVVFLSLLHVSQSAVDALCTTCQCGSLNPNACVNVDCGTGKSCNSCGSGCYTCCTVGDPVPNPTATPPPGSTPVPTPTGGGGGTVAPPLTPVPTTACTISCNRQVCGDTASSCSSNANCGAPYTCNMSSGKCQLCTNPGTACCGYCVPQGWGCSGSSCASYKNCKAWQGANLICDSLTGCANANPCATALGATSSLCYSCFEYCGAGNPGGASCAGPPPAVTNIQPSGLITPGLYTVSWNPAPGATSYYLAVNGGNNPWTCDANCNNCQPGDICSFQTATCGRVVTRGG